MKALKSFFTNCISWLKKDKKNTAIAACGVAAVVMISVGAVIYSSSAAYTMVDRPFDGAYAKALNVSEGEKVYNNGGNNPLAQIYDQDGSYYLVKNKYQLYEIMNFGGLDGFNDSGMKFKLANDITLSGNLSVAYTVKDGSGNETSTGTYKYKNYGTGTFKGELDGNGYQITIPTVSVDIQATNEDTNIGYLFGELGASANIHDLIVCVQAPTMNVATSVASLPANTVSDENDVNLELHNIVTDTLSAPVSLIDNHDATIDNDFATYDYITAKKTITKTVDQTASQETKYKVTITPDDTGVTISENDLTYILNAKPSDNSKTIGNILSDKDIHISGWSDVVTGIATSVSEITKEGNEKTTTTDLTWTENSFDNVDDTKANVTDESSFVPVWWEKFSEKNGCTSIESLNTYNLEHRTVKTGETELDSENSGYQSRSAETYSLSIDNGKSFTVTITPYVQNYKRTDTQDATVYEYDRYIEKKTTGTVTKVKAGKVQGKQVSFTYEVNNRELSITSLTTDSSTVLPTNVNVGVIAGKKDNGANLSNISIVSDTTATDFVLKENVLSGLIETRKDPYEIIKYNKKSATASYNNAQNSYQVKLEDTSEAVDQIPPGNASMPAITTGIDYKITSLDYNTDEIKIKVEPNFSVGGLIGYEAASSSTYSGLELAQTVNATVPNGYQGKISVGGLVGLLNDGNITVEKSIIDSDQIGITGTVSNAVGTLIGSSVTSAAKLTISNCVLGGNQAVNNNKYIIGSNVNLDGDLTFKSVKGASYNNGSGNVSPTTIVSDDLKNGSSNVATDYKNNYGVRYLSSDGGTTYRLIPNWVCTDISDTDLTISELKNPDSTNPTVDVTLSSLKRLSGINVAMDYRYMTITGGESPASAVGSDKNASKDKILSDISISPVSELDGKPYTSSWMKITQATFFDGHQYYVTATGFSKDYQLTTEVYSYGAEETVVRKTSDPDNDYICPYIYNNRIIDTEFTGNTYLFYRQVGSSDNYTKATDHFSDWYPVSKRTAYILFDTDTAEYEGFWVVKGYIYPLIKISPNDTTTAYKYTKANRTPVNQAKLSADMYQYDTNATGNSAPLDTSSHELDTTTAYNFLKGYTLSIKPYDYDSGQGAGATHNFKYYYRIDTSCPSDTDEVKNEIIEHGTEITSADQKISLDSYSEGSTVYLSVVRTRAYRKPSLITYKINIIKDWDDLELTAGSSTLWRDDVLTIHTSTNVNDVNELYSYASAQNGYDPSFKLNGIRYVIRTVKTSSMTTLKGLKVDDNLSLSSDIVAFGTITGTDGVLDGCTIPLDCLQYVNSNANFYVYLQFYGDDVCGGKVYEYTYQMPTETNAPSLIPSAGTSQHTAKNIGTGDSAYVVKEDNQAYVYAVDDTNLSYTVVTGDEKSRLESSYPSAGKTSPVTATEGNSAYVGCDGKWFRINGGTIYTDDGIAMTNNTGNTVQRTVSVIAFHNGYMPSKTTTFYYSVTPVQAAETVSFEPSDTSIARFSKIYLKNLTLNSEIYYMVDQNGADFSKSQLADLQSVTYGMNEAGLPKSVYKYDSAQGILVTGDSRVSVCAVAVSKSTLVSPIASKSYDVTEPGRTASVTSVPAGTATTVPTVIPGEKILLLSATSGADIYYSLTGDVSLTENTDGSYEIPKEAQNTTFLYNSTDGIVMPQKKDASDQTFTIYAVAVKKGMSKSAQSVLKFQYPSEVGEPVANIASGEVTRETVIKLTSSTEGAVIYYNMTTDGSEPEDPTISSMTYDKEQGITISKETKIKAIAVKNTIASNVVSFAYTVSEKLAAPTASLTSGSVSTRGAIVTLSAAEGATIFYTTDNTSPKDPENTSVMIGNSVILDGNSGDLVTIKAYASLNGKTDSDEATFTYTISQFSGGITADPPTGTELGAGSIVNLISDVSDATIYYTTDGSNPTAESKSGTSVKLDGEPGTTITIKAIAVSAGGETKAYALFSYKLKNRPAKVNASPAGGVLTSATTVTLTAGDGKIYYTTNGDDPTANSNLYTEPIKVTKGMTLKTVVITDDGEMSEISEFVFEAAEKVKMPIADIPSGLLEPATVVHLSLEDGEVTDEETADEDVTIYYSTDGTKPTLKNLDQLLVYTSDGISINRNVSIKAVAYKEGQQLSNVLELEYVVNKIPAVEEKARLLAETEENALHDTDTSELEDRREEYDFSGTAFTEIVLADYDNNTVVSTKNGVIPKNSTLDVGRISSNATLNDNVKMIFGDEYAVLSVYDISIQADGTEVQPDGTVEIGLPIPKQLKSAVVYMIYVGEDGTIQKLETRRDGQMAYAKTDHFSCYALVGADLSDHNTFSFQWIYLVFILVGYSVLFLIIYAVVSIYRVEKRRKERRRQKEQNENFLDGES
ncbi:MAG: chitobiase/beta-hexosaminidase C-terminal domain-containing protein [Lachnospiraceae bacterium]|nr:chitobiase/beta-hexosaminidase C-terminal domain-containing protein [Lachnospiraceae bacterium]